MNHLHYVLFCALITFSHSLKLLINDNEPDIESTPEEWEADIMFSYKPLLGKCKAATDFAATASSITGYGGAGEFCDQQCKKDKSNHAATAAEVKYYCKPPKGTDGTFEADDLAFEAVAAKWKVAFGNYPKRIKECAHITAKCVSMANTATNCKDTPITAFDIKASDCTHSGWKGDGKPDSTGSANVGYFCYTKTGIQWAKNDPKVKNMDGEEFDIMATGTFTLLSLQKLGSEKVSLEVLSTIDRAGTRCGATYIQNVTLRGQWVEDVGVPEIQVRAVPAVPKSQALEVNFDGSWQPSNSHWSYASVEQATSTRLHLKINQVKIFVTVDSHRIHEDGVKTKRFANFLNVNFQGVSKLSGISIRGLLGRDSHAEAAELPADCTAGSLLSSEKTRMFSSAMLI